MILDLTLPNNEHPPTIALKLAQRATVTGRISRTLLLPIVGMTYRRYAPMSAGVQVPETAVHIYDFAQLRQHDVGCSWKIATMEAKTIAKMMHQPPHQHLWFCIARLDRGHDPRPFLLGKSLWHTAEAATSRRCECLAFRPRQPNDHCRV